MKGVKRLIAIALLILPLTAAAQFSQLDGTNGFMLKLEAGYMPYLTNVGTADEFDFTIDSYHNATDLNILLGANISQDWFVGGGVGFMYLLPVGMKTAESFMGANVFADVDFRPIWKGVMGLDYQPMTIIWAPEIGARLGGSILFNHPHYDTPFSPMFEVYAGINWYYAHGLRNMALNWHSFYATVGLAYMHQAFMAPIRIGWRW